MDVPAGWTCRALTSISASDESCMTTAGFSNGVWTITTDNSGVSGANRQNFCVIELSGEGVEDSKDFLVRATFSPSGADVRSGPFAAIAYNMEDINDGDYIMMRMKLARNNVQMGYIEDGKSTFTKMGDPVADIGGGNPVKLEIMNVGEEETVYFNGVLASDLADQEPHFSKAGGVGFAFQNVMSYREISISGAELCAPFTCTDEDGTVYSGGDSWEGDDGGTCTCKESGISCACGDDSINCGGLEKWVDPDTCEVKCIRTPGYCYSSGDPHYRTFDGMYYDFHGTCTYQAADCGDFVVNFKNFDLYGRAPRYTGRIELLFKGETFAVTVGFRAMVDGNDVQVPYIKTYTNGDRVEIRNNGQLEILLYNKGRSPSVRARAHNNGGIYIDAEMWLHGSCADTTNGLCGTYNGNSGDDTTSGDQFKEYDENCPAPPPPYHPCNELGDWGKEAAKAICDNLKGSPFTSCHDAVSIGDDDNGVYATCLVDVCNCYIADSCACDTMESYAQTCINSGVDLSNWREEVSFCPYLCDSPFSYHSKGSVPVATCLEKAPEETGTARGCFCPEGTLLQDGECVDDSQCKCLHEGIFYNNGDNIVKEGECKTCTCQDAGEMVCEDMVCPELSCDDDELVSYKDDICCPYCNDEWVIAVNPEETRKKGQDVVFTCEIRAEGVKRKNIRWYKGDKKITTNISKDKLRLTIKDLDADDQSGYRCEATKDGKVASGEFELTVIMPAICEHEDGTTWEEATIYNPQPTEACTCDAHGEHSCACIDDGEECEEPTPVAWFNNACVKTCVPEYGVCTAGADPHYSTFDGTGYSFKGDCVYQFFGCKDIKMWADHAKDESSTRTKSLTIEFKTDTIKLEGSSIFLNGDEVIAPLHKNYKDGAVLSIQDLGNYKFAVSRDGQEPFVELSWDRASSYSVKAFGTCKGETTGMCGNWNDDAEDDFLQPDGTVAANAEDFGTSWAVDDEDDCPIPPPPPDMCELMGYDDRAGIEAHYAKVFKSGSLGKCAGVVDSAETINSATEEVCVCFGGFACGCGMLENYAAQCDAAGVDTSNWQMDNKFTVCTPDCPDGTVFSAKGPKPAPSCNKPNGGTKAQKGCFCPEGQVLEGGACIDLEDCQCEYAGNRYDIGETFTKEAECESCTCKGVGNVQCDEFACDIKCDDDELVVEVEDACCPVCMADWLSAVNPKEEGFMNKPVQLTCAVKDGADISGGKISWFFGTADITKKAKLYTVSDDGLTLTIKSMSTLREGEYKCRVEVGEKSSEASFEVTLPLRHEDLIEPVKETVAFIEGGDLVLEVKKLGGTIKEIYWECNGVRVSAKDDGIKINNGKTMNRLTIKSATLEDVGTCTCYANGIGTYDTADIEISGEENDVTITPQANPTVCTLNKKPCALQFTIAVKAGKVNKNDVRICKLNDDGAVNTDSCIIPKGNNPYKKGLGKTSADDAGQYVCTYNGVTSETVTLQLNAKKTE